MWQVSWTELVFLFGRDRGSLPEYSLVNEWLLGEFISTAQRSQQSLLPKMFDIHFMMINMFTLFGFLLQWKVLMGKKSNGDVCVEE